jgi:parallel beta-helix repeat protein/predicted outer membrane repeat protein
MIMKKLLLLTICFLMGFTVLNAQNNVDFSGEITTDVTWDSSIDTVKITGDVSIDTIGTLTIESGVVIEFQGAYSIDIEGSIAATGTESAPIIFTVSDTSGYYEYSHEGWLGIDFVNTDENADASTFDYCEFYYGKADGGDYWNSNGGVIFIEYFNKVEIENSLFKYNYTTGNGGAIHVKDADILIASSEFHENYCDSKGGAVNVSGDAGTCTANIYNSVFKNNYGSDGGAIRVRGGGDSKISGNIIHFNESSNGGGGLLFTGDGDESIVENNFIANNISGSGGGGIKSAGDCTPIYRNNIIVNNTCSSNGGGIKIAYESNPILTNNTIVNNEADYGGGIFTSCSIDSVNVYNTIIYGNIATGGEGDQVYMEELAVELNINFINCNIEGDSSSFYVNSGNTSFIAYTNNIDESPVFADAASDAGSDYETTPEDWMLEDASPCIDAGDVTDISAWIPEKDYFGNNRVVGGVIDIGAHESDASTGIAESKISNEGNLKIYPNPASEIVYIEASSNKYQIIEIIDLTGKVLIYDYLMNEKEQINISGLQSGLYFVKVSNQFESKVKRLVVD